MYIYRRRSRIDSGSIIFIIIFILVSAGTGYLAYTDRGKFWDILPFTCIPVIIISLIFIIVNFVRRTRGSTFFILFFLLSVTGLILTNFFGPFALNKTAEKSFDNKNYEHSINQYKALLDNYPNSRHANTALGNISFAYFSNKNYKEAIDSFNESISLEIFSDDNLEIKKSLEECYIKLSDEYYNNKEYELSAGNYLKAVTVLEDIKNNFSSTDEAFISIYKIPEYLYKAALGFNKVRNWEKSLECLEAIVNDYDESKYYYDASYLLSDTYISKSIELIDSSNQQEGVEEFLKIFELDALDYDYSSINEYQKSGVFPNISLNTLKKIAGEKYSSGEYEKSLFLYKTIIEYNPQTEEEITPRLIDSKLKSIYSSDHNLLEQPAPVRRFRGPGKSILVIENSTEFNLTVYLKGPDYRVVEVENNSTLEVEITSGSYETALDSDNMDNLPYYGELEYGEGQRYLVEYPIIE